MPRPFLALSLLLAGCTSSPAARGEHDAHHLARALSVDDLSEAPGHCRAIEHPGTSADCLATVAERLAAAEQGEQALALCRAIESELWRSECQFAVVDSLELRGEEARAACAEAGLYVDRCMSHLAMRMALSDGRLPTAVGEEVAWSVGAELVIQDYVQPIDVVELVQPALSELIRRRWIGGTMQWALCGEAPNATCVRAVYTTVQADRERLNSRSMCGAARRLDGLAEEAARVGATPWEPALEPTVAAAWIKHCKGPSGTGLSPGRARKRHLPGRE